MEYDKLNKIRQSFIPLYILSIFESLGCFGFAIYYIISNNNLKIINNIIIAVLAVLSVLPTIAANILTDDFYSRKMRPHINEELSKNAITSSLNIKTSIKKIKDADINNSFLIGKHHHYEILGKYEYKDMIIYDISMLSDMRFRGLFIKCEIEEDDKLLDYAFTNIRYYYKHRIKELLKTKTESNIFDNKFKTYTNRKYSFDDNKLLNFYNLSIGYKTFGFSKVANKLSLLISFPIKDGQKLFIPNVFEKIDDEFFKRIKDEVIKIEKIFKNSIM